MIKKCLLPLLIFTISGCKILKQQETKSVQALAKAITSAASLSGDFAKEYYSLELELKQLTVAFKVDTNQKISALKELISYQNKVDITITSYNAGYTILKSYADLLLSLTIDEPQKS